MSKAAAITEPRPGPRTALPAVSAATILEPQPGPQTAFLASPADIAVYGGAAGGGKTWALLFEPLRHLERPGFRAVVFRRNAVQARSPGGLWDESLRLYPALGGKPLRQPLEWVFPSGARIKFAHLEHESSVFGLQGSQIALIGFDELTHFSERQFFYLLSRNRSTCGIRPYVRAACNPDADSWAARFLAWWINPATGYARPERSGVLRWMVRHNDTLHWADSPDELLATHGPDCGPKSVTFIASSVFDNAALLRADPGYLANLKALPLVERERLLGGNWKIRPTAGLLFQRSWVGVVDRAPAGLRRVRWWDLAATEKTAGNDPDFTVAAQMGADNAGRFYLTHGLSLRKSPLHVARAIENLAAQDGPEVLVGLPQDPGQAGKAQTQALAARLAGHDLRARPESGSKAARFAPFSAQCEAGNVFFVRADWNEEFFEHLEAFPDGAHDDHADACAGAFNLLCEGRGPLRIREDLGVVGK